MLRDRLIGLANRAVRYERDPMGTHKEFLLKSLEILYDTDKFSTKRVVFEIGTGGESSRVLTDWVKSSPYNFLYSFESDSIWIDKYLQDYGNIERHHIIHTPNVQDLRLQIDKTLSSISDSNLALAFIDSVPWDSRVIALEALKDIALITLVHDVDYFPHNGKFGIELAPIKFKPRRLFRYPRLERENLGTRKYDKEFVSWIECFPFVPGSFTGPPTLVASNRISISAKYFHDTGIILGD